mgnify:CR=1 FL=1
MDIQDCLMFDPFDGDDGESRVLLDKMVVARKQHDCFHCGGAIGVGATHRHMKEVFDGAFHVFRWCGECCKAMIKYDTEGDWETYENRRKK